MQGLPIIDDGNSHKFFCALRLVVDSQATNQQKLFPQSARTKCVKPLVSKTNDLDEGTAKWNELFIFEVPRKVFHGFNCFIFLLLLEAPCGVLDHYIWRSQVMQSTWETYFDRLEGACFSKL